VGEAGVREEDFGFGTFPKEWVHPDADKQSNASNSGNKSRPDLFRLDFPSPHAVIPWFWFNLLTQISGHHRRSFKINVLRAPP